ncbi:hypothetical protein [Cupriavidus sp. CP313]
MWQATQADRVLQKLDQEDSAHLAGLLMDALRSIAPNVSNAALSAFSQLTMILIAAAVRHAITLQPREGRRLLALFKRTLPKDLSMLETWRPSVLLGSVIRRNMSILRRGAIFPRSCVSSEVG